MRNEWGLSPKQEFFCREFLVDFNATQAAIRAGYSARAARQTAAKLMAKGNIQLFLQHLMKERVDRLDVSADRVLQEIAKVAFASITDVVEIVDGNVVIREDISDAAKAAIGRISQSQSEYTTKDGGGSNNSIQVTMCDKMKALEQLMKFNGMDQDLPRSIASLKQYGTVKKTKTGYVFTQADATAE